VAGSSEYGDGHLGPLEITEFPDKLGDC
jgi:hypothetical protein